VGTASAERRELCQRHEGMEAGNGDRFAEGKALEGRQPQGRYRVKTPERSEEEQVAEVVRNGVSGTTAGSWQSRCWWTPSTSSVEGDESPGEALGHGSPKLSGIRAGLDTGHRGGDQPHERRQPAVESSMVAWSARKRRGSTPRGARPRVERPKANEAASAPHEALKRRQISRVAAAPTGCGNRFR
jgi:hypothetical protein